MKQPGFEPGMLSSNSNTLTTEPPPFCLLYQQIYKIAFSALNGENVPVKHLEILSGISCFRCMFCQDKYCVEIAWSQDVYVNAVMWDMSSFS